ncbi:MAG: hypothetical protein JWN48_4445 [Myxococcaceae bacterium]|nr:hypothetical protein [Myxococcaceae bacterium]
MTAPRRPAHASRGRLVALLTWLVLAVAPTRRAHAEREPETYARVIVESAALRSGPGVEFRILQVAQRDDSFAVLSRASVGHWLELALSDGGRAYVQGDAVWLFDASEEAPPPSSRWQIFAPPPLLHARGELAVSLGVLSGSGLLAVRPQYLLSPTFGIELNLAASVGSLGRLFLVGAGALVNLFPSWPITPFFTVGGGAARALPNSDAFIFESGTRSMIYGGGGLRFGFKQRLILRVEGRGYALFEADRLASQQEVSGGISAFF